MTDPREKTEQPDIVELLRQNHLNISIPEYLRTMACVHLETGRRVMPRYIDDEVFRAAADQIEQFESALWKNGAEILSLRQELAEARKALEPFMTWAANNVELVDQYYEPDFTTVTHYQWNDASTSRDRIVDWFGPSDFAAALAAGKEG